MTSTLAATLVQASNDTKNGSIWYTNDMPVFWIMSNQIGHLWFEFWIVEDGGMYAFAIAVLFFLCIFNQFLFWFLGKRFDAMKPAPSVKYQGIEQTELQLSVGDARSYNIRRVLLYVTKVVAYMIHTTLSAFLMLAIMKFNVGIMMTLVIGNTVGWTIFSLIFGNAEVKQDCH